MIVTILLRQLDYDRWATTSLFEAAIEAQNTLQDARLDVLTAHLVNANVHWVARLQNAKATSGVWEDRPTAESLPIYQQAHETLLKLMAHSDNDHLVKYVSYHNSKGEAFWTQRYDILQHLLLHSAHHRGQIAARLRELGVAPPQVDYIFWARQDAPTALVLPELNRDQTA